MFRDTRTIVVNRLLKLGVGATDPQPGVLHSILRLATEPSIR
jgi:hypothetical protein